MTVTKKPLISICCITYNQENYIRHAIDSFLMQDTDFPIEIIIHDDASTDKTADIVREYEKKYPDLIIPIYQTENQYSKGKRIMPLTFNVAKGKYIAICEGDDYWIDPLKLQKQITEMEKHPECHISFHPAIAKWENDKRSDEIIYNHSDKNKVFSTEEVINGKLSFMPTNSIILNRAVIPRISEFFKISKYAPISDKYIRIIGSENGGALYINKIMSIYRKRLINSWTDTCFKNPEFLYVQNMLLYKANNELDKFTNYKYSEELSKNSKLLLLNLSRFLINLDYDFKFKRRIANDHWTDISMKYKILWITIFNKEVFVKIIGEHIRPKYISIMR